MTQGAVSRPGGACSKPGLPLEELHFLHPRSIVKSTVVCQAAIRRFLAKRYLQRSGTVLEPDVLEAALMVAAPPPPIAVAMFFAKHLRCPGYIDVEDEAECIAAIICARENRLTLGAISSAHDEYKAHLSESHPALGLFEERFHELSVAADEEAVNAIRGATLPSEAEAALARVSAKWEAPRQGLNGDEVFAGTKAQIQTIRSAYEKVLIGRLQTCRTTEGYDAFVAEVSREFVGCPTVLRVQVREGRTRHKEQMELECSTLFGWPPAGPLPTLMEAGRKFRSELGEDHPVSDDFIMQIKRKFEQREKMAEQELSPWKTEILALRKRIRADPPPPKLLLEAYTAEYNERGSLAMEKVKFWEHDLGPGSPVLIKYMNPIMGHDAFLKHCELRVDELADDLRRLGPRPSPTLESADDRESRSIAAVDMTLWLDILQAEGWPRCEDVRKEFAAELHRAKPLVGLYRTAVGDEPLDQEGWHKPPGFEMVEKEMEPEMEAVMPDEQSTKKQAAPPAMFGGKLGARELPSLMDMVSLRMRLHGVSGDDVQKHSELLLLERCGDLIATECGIPRHCISNLAFWDPRKPTSAAEASGAGAEAATPGAFETDDIAI